MTGWIRTLIAPALTLVIGLGLAQAVEFKGRSERDVRESRSSERARDPKYHEAREMRPEWQGSPLARHEARDELGNERGHTLRNHVPDHANIDSIRQNIQERDAQQMRDQKAGTRRPDDQLSMYKDLKTAELATERVLRENRAEIEKWLAETDGKKNTLPLEGRDFKEPIGLVYSRGPRDAATGQRTAIDLRSEAPSDSNRVVLRREGKDGYFILTSYPTGGRVRETTQDVDTP